MDIQELCLDCKIQGERLAVVLRGDWRALSRIPSTDCVQAAIKSLKPQQILFDTQNLKSWDSKLLVFVNQVRHLAAEQGIKVDSAELPRGVKSLLDMAAAKVVEGKRAEGPAGSFERIGSAALRFVSGVYESLEFIGLCALGFLAFVTRRARFRGVDFFRVLQECGPQALPIVTLISVLVGLIIAYIGAIQLRQFGAEIYVANLVGLGMTREFGAVMVGIIMAGRTGAAFAAQLGSMKVNEEIDALRTLGISPIEFLVVPRMAALIIMLPLLCIYADLMGILGGALVGTWSLDIPLARYIDQTQQSVAVMDFLVGVVKSAFFGVLVALFGCLRGMQSGRNSAAVGEAATSAVVSAIVAITVADAIFAVLLNILGI